MKEQAVVDLVENHLMYKNRHFINIHGSLYSKGGNPDFMTLDKNGRLLGIECKVDGRKLVINQLNKAYSILESGGRFVVAVSDFDIDELDMEKLPKLDLSKYDNEFDEKLNKIKYENTTELILTRREGK